MKTQLLFRSALCLALIIVGARIQVPLPYFDYYTLQFTFVLLSSVLLPVRYAVGTMGAYILLGLMGVPIFAGGGGFAYVLRPSFGYLIGFLVTAGVLSAINTRKPVHTRMGYFGLNSLGIVIIYLFGITYKVAILAFYLNEVIPLSAILVTAFAIDIPADILMIAVLSMAEVKIVGAVNSAVRGHRSSVHTPQV